MGTFEILEYLANSTAWFLAGMYTSLIIRREFSGGQALARARR